MQQVKFADKLKKMKKIIIAFTVLMSTQAQAQVKTYSQATINTTMNVIAPEEEDVQNIGGGGEGRGGMNFRTMMDGETFFTTYLKDNLVKTNILIIDFCFWHSVSKSNIISIETYFLLIVINCRIIFQSTSCN